MAEYTRATRAEARIVRRYTLLCLQNTSIRWSARTTDPT